jgi:hypothetical protein
VFYLPTLHNAVLFISYLVAEDSNHAQFKSSVSCKRNIISDFFSFDGATRHKAASYNSAALAEFIMDAIAQETNMITGTKKNKSPIPLPIFQ